MPKSLNRPRPAGWKYCAIIVLGLVIVSSAGLYYCHGRQPRGKLNLIMPAAPSTAAPEPAKLSAWIHSLISPVAAIREKAVNQLIAAGDAALPALEKSFKGRTTPPLRRRLRLVRAAIARVDLLRGPIVTLNLHHATLRQVINRLCIPLGIRPEFYPLFASGAPIPPIFDHLYLSVDVQGQPVWAVVRRLAQVTGVSPGPGLFNHALNFCSGRVSDTLETNPVDVSGPFMFVLQFPDAHWAGRRTAPVLPAKPPSSPVIFRRMAVRVVSPNIAPNPRQIQLILDMLWCPAGNRLSRLGLLRHLQAVDSAGNSILLFKKNFQQQFRQWNQNRQVEFNGSLVLRQPKAGIKTIAMIRGSVPIVMSFDPVTRQINNLASGKASLDINGLHFKFGKPKPDPAARTTPSIPVWTVPVAIRSNMLDQRSARLLAGFLHSLQNNTEHALMFKSANGKYGWAQVISRGSNMESPYYYSFETGGPAPLSARVRIYRQRSVKLNVPFEFRNVPVPQ